MGENRRSKTFTFEAAHRLPHVSAGHKRVLWAHEIGADSIDSSLPLWTLRGFDLFRMALTDPHRAQGRLFS